MPANTDEPDADPSTSSRRRSTPADAQAGAQPGARRSKANGKTSGGTKPPANPGDILSGFANTTSHVVQQAASILEEEIAAGIIAAKQVEDLFINSGEIRLGNPDEVMQRFRRDAHDVIDILIDLVNVAAKSLGSLAQRVITIRSGDRPDVSGQPAPGSVPTLSMPQPIKAGEAAEIPMAVENESDTQTARFSFHSSDLVNESGDRIAAQQITMTPSSLTLDPHQTEKVTVTVHVPEGTPAGSYSGLLQATNLNQLRAVLVVQVS